MAFEYRLRPTVHPHETSDCDANPLRGMVPDERGLASNGLDASVALFGARSGGESDDGRSDGGPTTDGGAFYSGAPWPRSACHRLRRWYSSQVSPITNKSSTESTISQFECVCV